MNCNTEIDSPFTNYLYSEIFHCSLIVTCSVSVFISKKIEIELEKLLNIASVEPYGLAFFSINNNE